MCLKKKIKEDLKIENVSSGHQGGERREELMMAAQIQSRCQLVKMKTCLSSLGFRRKTIGLETLVCDVGAGSRPHSDFSFFVDHVLISFFVDQEVVGKKGAGKSLCAAMLLHTGRKI